MRFAIAGCGLVGRKRAKALGSHQFVACADVVAERAESLAKEFTGCRVARTFRDLVENPNSEAVIIATSNDALATLALGALSAGKHVLVEKPAARTTSELRPVLELARAQNLIVKVGFNHRFHPALLRARSILEAGEIGELMYIRGRYGHGGRLGYEKEWRADPLMAGGGELLDQGTHLIDLARWFAGEISEVKGFIGTHFWPMEVEDNAFVLLRTDSGCVASLHASWTEWKNLFSFEVFGRLGKLQIDGLGGSYGTERLSFYRMRPEMGPPETTIWEFPGEDGSWEREIENFASAVEQGTSVCGSGKDGLAALEVIEKLYGEAGRDHHS